MVRKLWQRWQARRIVRARLARLEAERVALEAQAQHLAELQARLARDRRIFALMRRAA